MELQNYCEVCGASHVSIAWYVARGKTGQRPRRYICSEQYFKAYVPGPESKPDQIPLCEECGQPMAEIRNAITGRETALHETAFQIVWLCLDCGCTRRSPRG